MVRVVPSLLAVSLEASAGTATGGLSGKKRLVEVEVVLTPALGMPGDRPLARGETPRAGIWRGQTSLSSFLSRDGASNREVWGRGEDLVADEGGIRKRLIK